MLHGGGGSSSRGSTDYGTTATMRRERITDVEDDQPGESTA